MLEGSLPDSATIDLEGQQCIKGKGAYDFNDLCDFTCSYGYCPVGACTCEQIGSAHTKPNATGITGYPAEGRDANYEGLCSFACNYGYCPSQTCDTVEHAMPIPTVSDFLPPACIAGTGEGDSIGLCSYACGYGHCPINICTCTATGPLVQPPTQTNMSRMRPAIPTFWITCVTSLAAVDIVRQEHASTILRLKSRPAIQT
jgi:hypothetical protein